MTTPRYLCSQLVKLVAEGREQWVNLEEIWREGAVLDCEEGVAVGAAARLSCNGAAFEGRVAGADCGETGWRVEITFSALTPWSIEQWRPEHALNPAELGLHGGGTT
jgi:hypothetical protein